MKIIIFFAVFSFSYIVHALAQKPATCCPKVLFASSQISDTSCDKNIKRISINSSGNVKIKFRNKERKYIDADSIWGIQQGNQNIMRFYQGNYYFVDQLSPVIKYSRRIGKSTQHYFSTGLNDPIYSFMPKLVKRYTDSLTYHAIAEEVMRKRHELSFELFVMNANSLSQNLWGGGIDIKHYPKNRWATGITLSVSGKKTDESFGFPIAKPLLYYYEAGWINQFDLVQNTNFRLGLNFTTGLAMTELRDKAQKEMVSTRHGYQNVPKKISASYYFLLQSGMDVSYKIISNRHYPDFFITGKMRYGVGLGKSNFGTKDNFSAMWFAIGVTMIGFDMEQF